jgi:hypothetical protein
MAIGGSFYFGFYWGTKIEYGYYYVTANSMTKFEKERLKIAKLETSLYREYKSSNQDSIKVFFQILA